MCSWQAAHRLSFKGLLTIYPLSISPSVSCLRLHHLSPAHPYYYEFLSVIDLVIVTVKSPHVWTVYDQTTPASLSLETSVSSAVFRLDCRLVNAGHRTYIEELQLRHLLPSLATSISNTKFNLQCRKIWALPSPRRFFLQVPILHHFNKVGLRTLGKVEL